MKTTRTNDTKFVFNNFTVTINGTVTGKTENESSRPPKEGENLGGFLRAFNSMDIRDLEIAIRGEIREEEERVWED